MCVMHKFNYKLCLAAHFSREKTFFAKAIDINQEISYFIKGLGHTPPSSRGLGHLPFTEATGIRIPLGVFPE